MYYEKQELIEWLMKKWVKTHLSLDLSFFLGGSTPTRGSTNKFSHIEILKVKEILVPHTCTNIEKAYSRKSFDHWKKLALK